MPVLGSSGTPFAFVRRGALICLAQGGIIKKTRDAKEREKMEYTVLKGTGIKVSKACVGTMTFGGQMDEKAACQAVDYAIEQGVNFFDTANLYYTGESERILGKALLGKRQDMIVTTKVSFPMSGCLNHEGLSRVNILRCVEESLKRLQTDYIDIYFLHKPDHTTPLEESLQAMEYVGSPGQSALHWAFQLLRRGKPATRCTSAKSKTWLPPAYRNGIQHAYPHH